MKTLLVNLAQDPYPIHIGSALFSQPELWIRDLRHFRVAVVTNTTVGPLYLARLTNALEAAGIQHLDIVLSDGERFKNRECWNLIHDQLIAGRCERSTTLIALGGGVIGDITGFAAATYLRGVPLVQIPTTLLAQVDSSVGGKTGINHPSGKNLIGAFHHPRQVLIDIDTLQTLPDREFRSGIAEIVKYGLIRDLPFLDWLDQNMESLIAREAQPLAHAIEQSCRNKAEIVASDPRESSGARALLNLGHTFGHAIETATGYSSWLHGEAVAAGTVLAAELSHRLGWLKTQELQLVYNLMERAGLPTQAPDLGSARYLELMALDKKVEAGTIRYVLLKGLGQAVLTSEVALDLVRQMLDSPPPGRSVTRG